MRWYAFTLAFLGACVHVPSVVTADHFTTPEPAATAEAAVEQGDPLLSAEDEARLNALTYRDPAPLRLNQPAPFPGALISEYDIARYPLVDATADRWRVQALTAQWQLARTERRDAEREHALERRVDFLATRAERRRRMMWIFLGTGIAVGVGGTAAITTATR